NEIDGAYKNLDFGTAAWIWVDAATGGGPGNAIAVNSGPNPGAGSVTFINGTRFLVRVQVFPKRATTIVVSDNSGQNSQITAVFQAGDINALHFIEIDWMIATQSFAIGTEIGFDLLVNSIVYQAPA